MKVAPSILSANFARLAEECQEITDDADWIHIDVMDGHFVPNITIGPCVAQSLRKELPTAFLDCHLMVTDPQRWVESFAAAKVDQFTFHYEAMATSEECRKLCEVIRAAGMRASISVKPKTAIDPILDLVKDKCVDNVLIMTVEPGFGGQKFMEDQMAKIRAIREIDSAIDIQTDGGINEETVKQVAKAGCNVVVVGSALFSQADRPAYIKKIKYNARQCML